MPINILTGSMVLFLEKTLYMKVPIFFFLRPGAIYGLTNKLNVYVNTTIGIRTMGWFTNNHSIHHRSENTSNDFDNAIGGLLGDSKLFLDIYGKILVPVMGTE